LNKEELIKSNIRDVTVSYMDFAGEIQEGIIQVNDRIVMDTIMVFSDLFKSGFRIHKIEPANGRSDKELIDNNITTSFNYRMAITPNGTEDRLSKHAWGLAIDINPKVNPAKPDCGMLFDYDSEFGVLSDKEVSIMEERGFQWGGTIFKGFWDSHHFEVPFTNEELKIQKC
jgi:hypothetical protein